MNDAATPIRSYRRVFRLERRIYRVDRFVLPLPGGVPLRGLAYFGAALVLVLALDALPICGTLLALAPLPLRFLLLPGAIAVLATQTNPDGRPAHRFLATWIAWRLRPHRTVDGKAVPAAGEPIRLHCRLGGLGC